MSGVLQRLVDRATGRATGEGGALRPRRPALFEAPAPAGPDLWEAHGQITASPAATDPPRPSAPPASPEPPAPHPEPRPALAHPRPKPPHMPPAQPAAADQPPGRLPDPHPPAALPPPTPATPGPPPAPLMATDRPAASAPFAPISTVRPASQPATPDHRPAPPDPLLPALPPQVLPASPSPLAAGSATRAGRRAEETEARPEPETTIHIGQLDIRADPRGPVRAAPVHRPAPGLPSLSDYLRGRRP